VLIALVFGVFDLGRAMSANVTVNNSSREGARYLIANAVSSGLSSYNSCQSSSGATAPSSTSGEGAAWRQLRAASLDSTQLSMGVYFYKAGNDTGTPTIVNAALYTPASGAWVLFTTSYLYHPTTPLIGHLIGTLTVTQTTTMVIE
jgi:Flp pilus assembly protein TadG